MKRRKVLLIILLVLAVIVGGLLFAALVTQFTQAPAETEPILFSENLYVLIVFALLLPIFLGAMIRHVIKTHNKYFNRMREQEIKLPREQKLPSVSIVREKADILPDGGTGGTATMKPSNKPMSVVVEKKPEKKPKSGTPRFYMLDKTDREMLSRERIKFNGDASLSDICEQFRNFSASRLGLYYDIDDIRRFIAGLGVTHIVIMQGMSGTGKTSLAYAFGQFLDNPSVIVPIQPMWKERTDLVGYYNEFTKRFNETVLLQKMYEANYSEEMYVTVLDEMNIARVEYYFAEFLSLLELPNPESRYLDVVSDKWDNDPKLLKNGQLRLPDNMWFIGTANNDDSTFSISDKVYDRAMVMNLDRKSAYFEAPYTEGMKLSHARWKELMAAAQTEYGITDRNIRRIRKLDEYMISKFHITFGNRIMKQIRAYVSAFVACGGDELMAIDDIMAKKVMRKLESQNPVYVRKAADGLCAYLDDLFGQDKMPLCKEAIRRIERNS